MENVTGVWDYKAIIDKRPATVNMRDMFTAKPYQDDSKCLGFKISTLKKNELLKNSLNIITLIQFLDFQTALI